MRAIGVARLGSFSGSPVREVQGAPLWTMTEPLPERTARDKMWKAGAEKKDLPPLRAGGRQCAEHRAAAVCRKTLPRPPDGCRRETAQGQRLQSRQHTEVRRRERKVGLQTPSQQERSLDKVLGITRKLRDWDGEQGGRARSKGSPTDSWSTVHRERVDKAYVHFDRAGGTGE